MRTSIKNRISKILSLSFILLTNLSAQDYVWENIDTPEGINTPLHDFNPISFGGQFMFTRIVSELPKQFIYSFDSSIIPYSWNQSALRGMHIVYPMKHGSGIIFSSTYQTPERAFLGMFEIRNNSILNPLGHTNPGSFASHPSMTSDGQTLFFSSDREGSIGGTDLWYFSKNAKGDWDGPYPMGEYINSPGNEITPFTPHPDTLYYATDGHGGKGGFDILMSVRENGTWLEPIPVEEVNSKWNDTEFSIINDTLAAFTSDRPGGKGNLDIYMLKKSKMNITESSSLALTPTTKIIEQEIKKTDNALAFRTFMFPVRNKLSIDDDAMVKRLIKELKKSQDAKVYLTIHPLTDKIIDAMLSENISQSQIIVDSTILESMILISMDSKHVYSPHARIESICNPQSFDIYISSVPENIVLEWEVAYEDSILKAGMNLPDSTQFKTSFYIPPFQDSIVIHAKGSNVMGMEIRDSLIIPIKRHIVDQSENIDSNSIPVIWHMKEMKALLPHFFRYAQSFADADSSSVESANAHPKKIQLFVTDYNATIVDKALKMLKNEPALKRFEISKVELSQFHPLAKIMRFSITRAPHKEYENVIPVLIQ